MYTLDLATILQLLREFRRNGTLRTEIRSGLPRMKKPCFVVIELQNGEPVSCHVKDAKGQTLLSGQEAFQAIAVVGELTWIFEARVEQASSENRTGVSGDPEEFVQAKSIFLQEASTVPVPAESANPVQYTRIPRHLRALSRADIATWPRRHRMVYVLIDGARNIGQIAAMLSQSPQAVEVVLREIQSTGAIALTE